MLSLEQPSSAEDVLGRLSQCHRIITSGVNLKKSVAFYHVKVR